MKTIILVLTLCITQIICIHHKTQSSIAKKIKHQSQASQFDLYQKSLMRKINKFRQEHFWPPQIQYSDELQQTAEQEVENLIANQQFEEHQNFPFLDRKIKNEYITEIVVKIGTENGLPALDIFSSEVIKAIEEMENHYLSFAYQSGGIAIQEHDEDDKKMFYVVLHLAKYNESTANDYPLYSSCKNALDDTYSGNEINIRAYGKDKQFSCEQSYEDGGWTLVQQEQQDLKQNKMIPFDPYEIQYSELLYQIEINSEKYEPELENIFFQETKIKFCEKEYESPDFDFVFVNDEAKTFGKGFYKVEEQVPSSCKALILEPLLSKHESISHQDNFQEYIKLYIR